MVKLNIIVCLSFFRGKMCSPFQPKCSDGWNRRWQASLTEETSNEHIWGGLLPNRLAVESLRVSSKDWLPSDVCQLTAYGINRSIWSGRDINSGDFTETRSQILDFIFVCVLLFCAQLQENNDGWGAMGRLGGLWMVDPPPRLSWYLPLSGGSGTMWSPNCLTLFGTLLLCPY